MIGSGNKFLVAATGFAVVLLGVPAAANHVVGAAGAGAAGTAGPTTTAMPGPIPTTTTTTLSAPVPTTTTTTRPRPVTLSPEERAEVAELLALTNDDRAAAGLRPLEVSPDLRAFAQRRAEEQAGQLRIFHDPLLRSRFSGWQALGENVGYSRETGDRMVALETAFLASPEHRVNVLRPGFDEVGIGVAVGSDGRTYVAVEFEEPTGR